MANLMTFQQEIKKATKLLEPEFHIVCFMWSMYDQDEQELCKGVLERVKKTSEKLQIKLVFDSKMESRLNELDAKLILQIKFWDVYGENEAYAIKYPSDPEGSLGIEIPIDPNIPFQMYTVYLYGCTLDPTKNQDLQNLF